jgi:DNA-binding XRE family transcriptional regulator
MFHKAINLEFKKGTVIEVTFLDGMVKQYDMAALFEKYPQLTALKNRKLFLSGRLMGFYGIVWNDELDLEAETVYQSGITVRKEKPAENAEIGQTVLAARARKGISQKELSELTGIDQSDISKIERGVANPSVGTLKRIANALGARLVVSMEEKR